MVFTVTVPGQAGEDLAAVYRGTADGVVRIETTVCDGGGVGSGFPIAPDLVATVAHVVDGARTIALSDEDGVRTGTVIGLDRDREVALVQASRPLSGHVFTLAARLPEVGDTVAAIGYPLAGPRSLSRGTVSGLDRVADIDGASLQGLIQTDAALNPGNSGGPLIDLGGAVVGLVEAKVAEGEGLGLAVPATTAAGLLHGWERSPAPPGPAEDCAAPVGPDSVLPDVTVDDPSVLAAQIGETFRVYATAINTGDYLTAYAMLGPRARAATSYETFARGLQTSYLFDIHVRETLLDVAGTATAQVGFTSVQDAAYGHDGQTCSAWVLTYTLTYDGGQWLIDRAVPLPGRPTAC